MDTRKFYIGKLDLLTTFEGGGLDYDRETIEAKYPELLPVIDVPGFVCAEVETKTARYVVEVM